MNIKSFLQAGFFVFLLLSCGKKKEQELPMTIKPVKYSSVVYSGGIQSKVFNGAAKSGSETKLSFRANGLIVLLNGKVGDRVQKGKLLARLDQKDISLAYEKSKASVASAKIQLETAKSNLERIKGLYQSNSATLSDYEQAKNSFASATSGYQAAEKSRDIQASQFEYTKIVAPTSGIITEVNANINEFAQAGSPIFVISSEGGGLEINVGVPESYISKIHHGDEVEVFINEENVKGTVTEVGFSTGSAATYSVIVKLINPGKDLRPGMPAEVTFQFGSNDQTEPQLMVPVKAVGEDESGNFVFLLVENENGHYTVNKQKVEIGSLSNEGFLVNEGLSENDLVATAGLRTLHNGMIVSLIKE